MMCSAIHSDIFRPCQALPTLKISNLFTLDHTANMMVTCLPVPYSSICHVRAFEI